VPDTLPLAGVDGDWRAFRCLGTAVPGLMQQREWIGMLTCTGSSSCTFSGACTLHTGLDLWQVHEQLLLDLRQVWSYPHTSVSS
jgi:hypothetical protein